MLIDFIYHFTFFIFFIFWYFLPWTVNHLSLFLLLSSCHTSCLHFPPSSVLLSLNPRLYHNYNLVLPSMYTHPQNGRNKYTPMQVSGYMVCMHYTRRCKHSSVSVCIYCTNAVFLVHWMLRTWMTWFCLSHTALTVVRQNKLHAQ